MATKKATKSSVSKTKKKQSVKKSEAVKSPTKASSVKKVTSKKKIGTKAIPKKVQEKKVDSQLETPQNWNKIAISLFAVLIILLLVVVGVLLSERTSNSPVDSKDGIPTTPTDHQGQNPSLSTLEHTLIVIEDEQCQNCQVDPFIDNIKENIFPKLQIEKVPKDSAKGKEFINEFELKTLPAFFFSESLNKEASWETDLKPAFVKITSNKNINYYELAPQVFAQSGLPKVLAKDITLGAGVIRVGNPDAKVRVIELSDYECPYCAIAEGNQKLVTQFKSQAPSFEPPIPQLFKDYVDTGKVEFVYINLVLHPTAKQTHLAALCANEQAAWTEYNSLIFKNFEQSKTQSFDTLLSYAKQLNLDEEQFKSCVEEEKYNGQLIEDLEFSKSLGISGTPGFIVGNQIFSGVISYPQMKQALESALAQS